MQQRVLSSLAVAQAIGIATLLRSVAYDRWITVLVSALLIGGTIAAQRGRTWGVALAFAAACWFPVAFAVGIAPPWFVVVGVVGAMPFLRLLPALTKFDRQATALLVGISATMAISVAVAWKAFAMSVFTYLPLLRPSLYPHHALSVAALAGLLLAIRHRGHTAEASSTERTERSHEGARLRVADASRGEESSSEHHEDEQWEHDEAPARMRAR